MRKKWGLFRVVVEPFTTLQSAKYLYNNKFDALGRYIDKFRPFFENNPRLQEDLKRFLYFQERYLDNDVPRELDFLGEGNFSLVSKMNSKTWASEIRLMYLDSTDSFRRCKLPNKIQKTVNVYKKFLVWLKQKAA